jgi:ACS family hexuronate transporter-like MFS transporter
MLATIINYMDRMALNQMGTRIKLYFAIGDFKYSWLEAAFSLAFGIGAIITGFIVDRVSVRWVYPAMVLGWSCVGVCTGFVESFAMLFVCRFLLGIFEAGNWPCGIRTTRAILAPSERSLGNSLFQSGTALGAVLTPQLLEIILSGPDSGEPEIWRYPFRLIGSFGLVWIVIWFLSVPSRMVNTVGTASAPLASEGPARFRDVFLDRRYWAVVAVVISVNIIWHGYRTWLPLYLRDQRGFTEREMNNFSTIYYLVADVGAWTIGLTTLLLCRLGWRVHQARLWMFGGCAVVGLTTLAIPFLPNGLMLEAGLLVVGFAALGLFPTYFAFSQEITSKHQGKLTGTLGICAHFSLSAIYPVEGWICDATHSKEWVLGGIGLAPIAAFLVLLVLWPTDRVEQPQELLGRKP